jgi:methylated-DNA-[protein]-cysteine S-methyltransferase
MKKRDEELIALVMGDAEPSPQLQRWLETAEGQRELEAYRSTLTMLETAYGRVPQPKRVVYYTALRTPVGRLLIAATDAGLVRVAFDQIEASFVADLQKRMKADVVKSADRLAGITAELNMYFAGKRHAFDVPVDLSLAAPFQRSVLLAAREVPAGTVVTYGEIAKRIGRPTASRAVGQALGHNPVPIVIPCHRIVSSGGRLGGYIGGLDVKRKLLKIEGAYSGTESSNLRN